MRQTDYGFSIPLGLAGGIFDLSDKSIVTRLLDPGAVAVPGMGYVKGKKPGETISAPTEGSTSNDFEGVFVHGSKNIENDSSGKAIATEMDPLGLMQHGRIWVYVPATATTEYGKGIALITSGDNTGMFTDTDDAAEVNKVAINGKFLGKNDVNAAIAVIEI